MDRTVSASRPGEPEPPPGSESDVLLSAAGDTMTPASSSLFGAADPSRGGTGAEPPGAADLRASRILLLRILSANSDDQISIRLDMAAPAMEEGRRDASQEMAGNDLGEGWLLCLDSSLHEGARRRVYMLSFVGLFMVWSAPARCGGQKHSRRHLVGIRGHVSGFSPSNPSFRRRDATSRFFLSKPRAPIALGAFPLSLSSLKRRVSSSSLYSFSFLHFVPPPGHAWCDSPDSQDR